MSVACRRALWRGGLLEPGWTRRLSQAPEALIQFIRGSWQIAGFEYAVKAFFGNRLQKQAAVMAIRLASSIANRNPIGKAHMILTPEVGYAPGAGAFMSLQMECNGGYFIFLPWTELNEQTVNRQFACHQRLFGDASFRWVLSSSTLGMQKEEVLSRLKGMLETKAAAPAQDEPNDSDQEGDEVDRLRKMVIVLP